MIGAKTVNARTEPERTQDRISVAACLCIAFLTGLPFAAFSAFSSAEALLRFFPDDAFYYLQTASNFAARGMISFDGMHETNGFHPLYFAAASLLACIFGKPGLLHAAFVFHGICIFLSAVIIVRSARVPSWPGAALLAFLCAPTLFLYIWYSAGMESGLVLLATALLYAALVRCGSSGFRAVPACAGLGCAIAMLLLARLDAVICIVPLAGYFAFRLIKEAAIRPFAPRRPAPLMLVLMIPFLSCLAYLALSLRRFGHIMPVSATAKNIFFLPFSESWTACTSGGDPAKAAVLLLPLCAAALVIGRYLLAVRRNRPREADAAKALLAMGVLLYYLYLRFFASNFFRWYFAFPLAFTAAALGDILPALSGIAAKVRIPRLRRGIVTAGAVAAGALYTSAVFFYGGSGSVQQQLYQVALQMRRTLPENAVVATFDAGTIGYFSGRRIVNLDGLANDYDYVYNCLVPRRFGEYFITQGISYFLVRDNLIDNIAEVKSGRYARAQFRYDPRIVLKKEAEVFRCDLPGNFFVVCYKLSL